MVQSAGSSTNWDLFRAGGKQRVHMMTRLTEYVMHVTRDKIPPSVTNAYVTVAIQTIADTNQDYNLSFYHQALKKHALTTAVYQSAAEITSG